MTVLESPYGLNMESSDDSDMWGMFDFDMDVPQVHEHLSPSAADPVASSMVCCFFSSVLLALVDGHLRSRLHLEKPENIFPLVDFNKLNQNHILLYVDQELRVDGCLMSAS